MTRKPSRKPSKRPKPGKPISSTRALAAALGVSQSSVVTYTHDPRWPFLRAAPWPASDVEAMKRWRREQFTDDPEISRARLDVLIENAAKLKLARLVKEGVYVKRETTEVSNARKWAAWREAHARLPRALRQQLADCPDPGECGRILADALKNIMESFNKRSG